MKEKTVNAKISGTMLGVEDHGILTCMVHLDYGGAGQGFGGYAFDEWDEKKKERFGVSFGMEAIRRILDVTGVTRWEDLPGTHVRAVAEHMKVHKIGHILEDKWFSFDDLAKEMGIK
jgi:hypothetical protein